MFLYFDDVRFGPEEAVEDLPTLWTEALIACSQLTVRVLVSSYSNAPQSWHDYNAKKGKIEKIELNGISHGLTKDDAETLLLHCSRLPAHFMIVNTNKDDEATKLWKRTYIDTISVDAMIVDEEKDDAATKQWKRADREALDEIVRILKFPLGLSLAGFVIRTMRRRARNCTNFGFADYLQAYKNAFPEQEKDSYRLQVAINQDYKRSQDQAI